MIQKETLFQILSRPICGSSRRIQLFLQIPFRLRSHSATYLLVSGHARMVPQCSKIVLLGSLTQAALRAALFTVAETVAALAVAARTLASVKSTT